MKSASLNYLFESGIQETNYKTLSLKVRASDLLRAEIPNAPNLRQPSKNKVVKGIIDSIKKANGLYEMAEPIHVSVKRAERYKVPGKKDSYGYELELREPSESFRGDGILNGGHRMETFRQLVLDGFNLDNVFVEIKVYIGLNNDQLMPLVTSLNNSQAVKQISVLNYSGEFDWLKEILPYPEYKVRYSENESINGLPPNQPFCDVGNFYKLMQCIDLTTYKGITGAIKVRHPIGTGSSGVSAFKHPPMSSHSNPKIIALLPDLVKVQTWVCMCIQNSHNRFGFHPKVKSDVKSTQFTHLPDGSILNVKIPNCVFTNPIISAFRPWLTEEFQWIFPLDSFGKDLASKLVTKYRALVKQSETRQNLGLSDLGRDADLWDSLYETSLQIREEFMIKQSSKPKNGKVTKLARIA